MWLSFQRVNKHHAVGRVHFNFVHSFKQNYMRAPTVAFNDNFRSLALDGDSHKSAAAADRLGPRSSNHQGGRRAVLG